MKATLNQLITHSLEESKAFDIVQLDVSDISTVTDHMIICSGRSTRHVKAIADRLLHDLKQHAYLPLSTTGESYAQWILVDFADIIVHIMLPESRDYYQLEKLWTTSL